MKKTIAIIITAVFAFFGTANAQNQKLGHLNSADIIQAMPEYKQLTADVQKQEESYKKALEGMETEYQKDEKELQTIGQDKSTPDAVLETKYTALQELGKRIQDFQGKANEDLQKYQQDKMKPIDDKIKKAIKEVAVAEGYSYIFDILSGAVVYFPEATNDVTDLVMKKLNITRVPSTSTGTGMGGGK